MMRLQDYHKKTCDICPIAQALHRQGHPNAKVSAISISDLSRPPENSGIWLKQEQRDWIDNFDRTLQGTPFEFELGES
jgi:hypothetical protein